MYPLDMPLAPHPTPPQTSETGPDSLSLNNNWVGKRFNYTFGGKTYARGQGYWTQKFEDIAAVPISPDMPRDGTGPPRVAQQRVRQAYRAALSFTDRNIGEVVAGAKAERKAERSATMHFHLKRAGYRETQKKMNEWIREFFSDEIDDKRVVETRPQNIHCWKGFKRRVVE